MLDLRVHLTERRLTDEFVAALQARRLPEKFFYWFPLSVRAWIALCGEGPYRNFSRSHSLARRFAEGGPGLPAGNVEVWSLGPGNGEKDLLILEGLRARGARVEYRAVDASLALLEIACQAVADAGFPAFGHKADLTDAAHRAALAPAPADPPRLYLLLGNILGAFDPLEFAQSLRSLLRPRDRLLVDGEIEAGAETLAGYDNPVNRRFAFAPLASIGLDDADGELIFTHAPDPRGCGLSLVSKRFRARRDLALRVAGLTLAASAGEEIAMASSHKYSPDAFERVLSERVGLEIERLERADDGRYAMALGRPRH